MTTSPAEADPADPAASADASADPAASADASASAAASAAASADASADASASASAAEVGRQPQTARKRRAIIGAAAAAFLRNGYLGTSVDEIAAAAGVSKQTVYKHFADKQRLFREVVIATVDAASDPVHEEVRSLPDSGDVEADLRDLARRQLALVMQTQIMQLRRLVIGEAGRFPELGRMFYEQGPGRTIAALAASFEQLAARGLLHLEDPLLAAAQFNWLIMSAPLNHAMLFGADGPPDATELEQWADAGVRTFLAAYGRPHSQQSGASRPSAVGGAT